MDSTPDGRRLGSRLRQEIERRGMTVTDFQQEMDVEGVPGTSYANVQRYLGGQKQRPSAAFLHRAAEVLGVRVEYLMLLDDHRTDEELEREAAASSVAEVAMEDAPIDGATMGRRWRDEDFQGILEDVCGDQVPALARATLAHHWRRVHVAASTSPATTDQSGEDVLRALAEAVTAPLEALDVRWADMEEDAKTDYVVGVLPAIAHEWERHLRRLEVEALTSGPGIIRSETQNQEDTNA